MALGGALEEALGGAEADARPLRSTTWDHDWLSVCESVFHQYDDKMLLRIGDTYRVEEEVAEQLVAEQLVADQLVAEQLVADEPLLRGRSER